MAESEDLSQVFSNGPITALEFVCHAVIAGCGNQLLVYNTEYLQLEARKEVLHGASIHGISKGPSTESSQQLICVYGAKETCVVLLKRDDAACCEVEILNPVFQVSDWIWEAHWLKQGKKKDHIALALAHNSVVLWDWKNSQVSSVKHCVENCILYCAHLIGDSWDTLILAAGTVFNQVVLWPVHDQDDYAKQNTDGEKVPVMHTLTGHKGVIFSIKYHATHRKLCSVSDDRSIQIWDLNFPCGSNAVPSIKDWKSMKSELIFTLFGHTARVWDAVLMNECFATVGEDATCIVWDYNGKIMSKFKGHKGRNIWSIATNDDETVLITGGGDSSIRSWELQSSNSWSSSHLTIDIPTDLTMVAGDFPRVVSLICFDSVSVMMNSGCFATHCLSDGTWKSVFKDERFVSYSVVSPCPDKQKIAIGSITGVIKIVVLAGKDKVHSDVLLEEQILFNGKVLGIVWITEEMLLVSGPDGCCRVLKVSLEEDKSFHSISLKISSEFSLFLLPRKHRWITAAILVHTIGEHSLICGDKDGSIHTYSWPQIESKFRTDKETLLQPSQTHHRIHGKTGVTSLYIKDEFIYSSGRDGFYRQWEINGQELHLRHSVKVSKGFEWIERIEWCDGDMLIYGFLSAYFVVWNLCCNQQIISVHCGGGHRSWGCFHGNNTLRFVYLKAGKISVVDSQQSSKQNIIKSPLHGRELCDVKFIQLTDIQEDHPSFLVCTTSEDTNINIGVLQGPKQLLSWKPILNLKGHLSSVRCVAISSLWDKNASFKDLQNYQRKENTKVSHKDPGSNNFIIFTGGGRAEIRAWKLCIEDMSDQKTFSKNSQTATGLTVDEDSSGLNVETLVSAVPANKATFMKTKMAPDNCTYEELSTHFLGESRHKRRYSNWKAQKLFLDPETRIMSLAATPCTNFIHYFKSYTNIQEKDIHDMLQDWHIVSAAGSDGVLRVFIYSYATKELHLLSHSSIHMGCVIKVMHFVDCSKEQSQTFLLFSTSTNGCIVLWSLWDAVERILKSVHENYLNQSAKKQTVEARGSSSRSEFSSEMENNDKEGCVDFKNLQKMVETMKAEWQPLYQLKTHQSGVNSISTFPYKGDSILVASGGDDNAMAVQMIEVVNSKVTVLANVVKENAHAAQITGIWLVSPSIVVSASIDQRICVWNLLIEDNQMALRMVKCKFIHTADVSSMDVYLHRGTVYLLIGGEGLSLYSFK